MRKQNLCLALVFLVSVGTVAEEKKANDNQKQPARIQKLQQRMKQFVPLIGTWEGTFNAQRDDKDAGYKKGDPRTVLVKYEWGANKLAVVRTAVLLKSDGQIAMRLFSGLLRPDETGQAVLGTYVLWNGNSGTAKIENPKDATWRITVAEKTTQTVIERTLVKGIVREVTLTQNGVRVDKPVAVVFRRRNGLSMEAQVQKLAQRKDVFAVFGIHGTAQQKKAEFLLNRAIAGDDQNARLYSARGLLNAIRNQATAAANDYQKFAALDMESKSVSSNCTLTWMDGAAAQLLLDKSEPYQSYVHKMLTRFSGTKNVLIAERIVKCALLRKINKEDQAEALRLADIANDPNWIFGKFAKALADYRVGDFKAALTRANECLARKRTPRFLSYQARLLIAMSKHRQGDVAGYRKTLQTVKAEIEKNNRGFFHNRVFTQTLLREAVQLGDKK